jgi:hypothetical protein
MSVSDLTITLLIEIICGGAGGLAVGHLLRSLSLGDVANAVTGSMGGLIFTWLAGRIPGVGRFVGHVESAADSTVQGVGGLTPTILVGVGIAGLLGGSILVALAGFAKRRFSG